MKILILALLIFPITSQAVCKREESLYTNSLNLHIEVNELHESSKKLFKEKKISVKEMAESFNLFNRTLDMVLKSQRLYYECQARIMV